MGCDIHAYREKKVDGKWVAEQEFVDEYNDGWLDVPFENRYTGRNYDLFGILSKGVRRDMDISFEPRGLPIQLSGEVSSVMKGRGSDGHSHSYLYLHELTELEELLKSSTVKISGMKDADELEKLKQSKESDGETDWMLLYPYCAWSSDKNHVEFEIDVPASFIVGDCLRQIIDSFEKHDDLQRLVFFFDN